jgi:hypothetical protein
MRSDNEIQDECWQILVYDQIWTPVQKEVTSRVVKCTTNRVRNQLWGCLGLRIIRQTREQLRKEMQNQFGDNIL